MNEKKKKLIYSAAFILLLSSVFILNKLDVFTIKSPQKFKEYIISFGMLSPIIYIILFTLVPLTLFPDSILAIASGLVFGLYKGFILTMIGALCGATLSFYISRLLGKEALKKIITKEINYFEEGLSRNGFFIILVLRLIPLLPFDVISYGAGLSKIKYKDFIFATLIGIIPGAYIYVNLGEKSSSPMSIEFYISIALLLILFISSYFIKKKIDVEKLKVKMRA
ncbi:Uncharacterized membrane protein YdjX, TVP38/TMEM64 family, SNARE-associated domain [Caloramator quimbayensis]|uniref:TVP38/TMEM64 family membrane protein n=1 Tax=Caloramator quimbayensis TaxID=1147123 RepID=A0A1T4X1W0_9CLOT|nr:TVP38/TMEM64 family protein [Caloramator quimbayensis]SKA83055.1 Uncharacterized membrane protein YdjX, TVP38/TMEM64 family, SNARE-associated domain [Caloramator quimbayensis]